MLKFLSLTLPLFMLAFQNNAKSQLPVSIPAYTAYMVPAEADESKIFSKDGIHNWTDWQQKVQFHFKIKTKGNLQISLLLKSNTSGNKLSVSIGTNDFIITVPKSKEFKSVRVGTIKIRDTGFYTVTLSPLLKLITTTKDIRAQILSSSIKQGDVIADIKTLELGGDAIKNIHFNTKPRRNSASVHLFYPLPDSLKVLSFYNEITIPKNADVLHSYYMACGFTRGYFGIQVNSPTERRVIFSVWDAGNEAVDRNKVAEENKVQLIAKGDNVFADGFGNEGTGGHSHWVFNWKTGETYKFLVTAVIDSVANTTTYTGYFFIPEIQKWKLIASFKAPKDGKPLRRLYSFVENFDGANGQLYRKAYFGNQWVRKDNGEWEEITKSRFSYDATGKAGDRIDYGAGVENNLFYLWNGGFRTSDINYNDELLRPANSEKPVIDLYKNADSLKEAILENEKILSAIRAGKFDTTGSINGLYYKILKEGQGDPVSLNDIVTVFYTGKLLNDSVFDATKDKPAVFPLKRLIKGWQLGVPFCRVGGKIRLIIPSALAYSIRNSAVIRPNSVLVFDIEVVETKHQD